MKKWIAVLCIFIAAFTVRVFFARDIPLRAQEKREAIVAKEISFNLNNLNLPVENRLQYHPALVAYIARASVTIFGETPLGMRMLFVLFGTLASLVVYLLAREGLGHRGALLAMALYSFGAYAVIRTIRVDTEAPRFFLETLALLFFWRGIKYNKPWLFISTAVTLGIAYYVKEVAVIFPFLLFLYLITLRDKRYLLREKNIYIAGAVFLAIILPHIISMVSAGTSLRLFAVKDYINFTLLPKWTGINFFLVKPLSCLLGVEYRTKVSWDDSVMGAGLGILLFAGVLFSLRNHKDGFIRMMLVICLGVLGILTFMTSKRSLYGQPNWADPALIPAMILTGAFLANQRYLKKIYAGVFLAVALLLGTQAYGFLNEMKGELPPYRYTSFLRYDPFVLREYLGKREYERAYEEAYIMLRDCPNSVEVHASMGEIYFQRGLYGRAAAEWLKALEIEPFYAPTIERAIKIMNGGAKATSKNETLVKLYLTFNCYLDGINRMLSAQGIDSAIAQFHKALDAGMDDSLAHYYLGNAILRKKMPDAAVREFEDAIRLKDNFTRAYADLGYAYFLLKENKRALETLNLANRTNRDDIKVYLYRSRIYEELGELKKSRADYKDAIDRIFDVCLWDVKAALRDMLIPVDISLSNRKK